MTRLALVFLFLIRILTASAQEQSTELQRVLRANLLNPGFEYELPFSQKSVLAVNPGIGINSSFVQSRFFVDDSGLTYFVSPFLDLSYKNIYNRKARKRKSKNLKYNSGNYWGIKFLTKFNDLGIGTTDREDNIDFSLSPTWGIQRAYGNFHLLFEFSPSYYFDTKGNHYFFPLMIQLNLGFNLKEW